MVAARIILASLISLASATLHARDLLVHESIDEVPENWVKSSAAPTDHVLKLRVALKQTDSNGLIDKLLAVSTPSNPEYGNHLSKEEVDEYVAPTSETLATFTEWLKSNEIEPATALTSNNQWQSISIPVEKANKIFDADFSVYTHSDTQNTAVRTLSYSLPATLRGLVSVIHPTVTFPTSNRLKPVLSTPAKSAAKSLQDRASVPSSCADTVTPACLQDLYGIPVTPATQSSNTLGVAGFIGENANKADLKDFLKKFRTDISDTTVFSLQTLDGGSNSQSSSEAGEEADLDVQYTVGLATGVPVIFISVGDDYQDGDLEGFLDIINFLLGESNPPQVLTTSYGENENSISRALAEELCNAYVQLGALGTSILFASGDGGVSGSQSGSCSKKFIPTFPSGCPFLTSVGATTGISPESAATFSAGGFSNYFDIPSYQSDAVSTYLSSLGSTNKGKYNASGRGYPDVSAQGENVQIYFQGDVASVAGTSCASPIFASTISLINDELIAAGKSPLGFLNPFLYANPSAFNDITTGDNPGCGTNGFPAVAGWDPVTGLGTPNYAGLRAAAGLS